MEILKINNYEKQILLKVTITNLDIDVLMQKYASLRIYLSNFTRTADGGFISNAETVEGTDVLDKATIDLRNAILDWSFNEAGQYSGKDDENGNPIYEDGDANKFFNTHPDGFKFKFCKLCEL